MGFDEGSSGRRGIAGRATFWLQCLKEVGLLSIVSTRRPQKHVRDRRKLSKRVAVAVGLLCTIERLMSGVLDDSLLCVVWKLTGVEASLAGCQL